MMSNVSALKHTHRYAWEAKTNVISREIHFLLSRWNEFSNSERVKLRIIAWLFHLYIQLISLTDKNRDYNICISDKTKFINSFVIQVLTVLLHVFCQNMQFSQLVYFKTIQFRNTITLYCIKTKINW
jgi:hypothetical protein